MIWREPLPLRNVVGPMHLITSRYSDPTMPRPAPSPALHDHIRLMFLLRLLVRTERHQEARYIIGILQTDLAELGYPAAEGWPQPGEAAPAGWDVYAAVLGWCRGPRS